MSGTNNMSEATHTPGPWYLDLDSEIPAILASGREGNEICLITARKYKANDDGEMVPFFTDEDYANARLIEAAPDFFKAVAGEPDLLDQPIDWVAALLAEYKALRSVTPMRDKDVDGEMEMINAVERLIADARAAIAKATGQ